MKQYARITFMALSLSLASCRQTLNVDGFDPKAWKNSIADCGTYRLKSARALIEKKATLLGANQNEIKHLLGNADEHELYDRNQKFFHYRLTPAPSCGTHEALRFLSIRFNAMGKARDIQITLR